MQGLFSPLKRAVSRNSGAKSIVYALDGIGS